MSDKKSVATQKRIVYFDYLRIIAIASVIILHVAAQNWYTTPTDSFEWGMFNIFDSLTRWGVPVFVMISGALFLSKDQPIVKLYRKNILKILIILVFWTIVYTLWQLLVAKRISTPKDFMIELTTGPYHLWFLYMIAGLYMVVPFLRKIIKDQKNTKYFLILSFIFCFLIPEITGIIALKSELIAGIIEDKLEMMRLFMVLGYAGYFVLGYYLNTMTIKKKAEILIYISGIMGAVFTIVATSLLSNSSGVANVLFYNNLTINVAMMSVAIFVFFKKHLFLECRNKKRREFLQLISRCSLGVYLIHVLVLNNLDLTFGINSLSFNPIISVPLLSLIILAISYPISIILYKIPLIGKWIV